MRGIHDFFHRGVGFLYTMSTIPLFILVVLTAIDVVARYVFNTSFFDAIVLSYMMMASVIWFALPGVTLERKHVCVSILDDRLSHRLRTILDIFSSLTGGALLLIIAIKAAEIAFSSYVDGEYDGSMQLPIFPVKCIYSLGAFFVAFAFFSLTVQSCKELFSNHKKNIKKDLENSKVIAEEVL